MSGSNNLMMRPQGDTMSVWKHRVDTGHPMSQYSWMTLVEEKDGNEEKKDQEWYGGNIYINSTLTKADPAFFIYAMQSYIAGATWRSYVVVLLVAVCLGVIYLLSRLMENVHNAVLFTIGKDHVNNIDIMSDRILNEEAIPILVNSNNYNYSSNSDSVSVHENNNDDNDQIHSSWLHVPANWHTSHDYVQMISIVQRILAAISVMYMYFLFSAVSVHPQMYEFQVSPESNVQFRSYSVSSYDINVAHNTTSPFILDTSILAVDRTHATIHENIDASGKSLPYADKSWFIPGNINKTVSITDSTSGRKFSAPYAPAFQTRDTSTPTSEVISLTPMGMIPTKQRGICPISSMNGYLGLIINLAMITFSVLLVSEGWIASEIATWFILLFRYLSFYIVFTLATVATVQHAKLVSDWYPFAALAVLAFTLYEIPFLIFGTVVFGHPRLVLG